MASKAALVALVLVALVAGATAAERGHAVPLRRAEQSLRWMNGVKGGSPTGIQLSVTAHRRAMIGEGGSRHVGEEEGKFIGPTPGFKMPPLPPTRRN